MSLRRLVASLAMTLFVAAGVAAAGTGGWTTASPLATARFTPAAAMGSDGRIYAIGGQNGTTVLASVEAYEARSDTWSPAAPLPTPRRRHAAASGRNGEIYVVGGLSPTSCFVVENRLDVYDPRSDSWTAAAPMPTARAWLAAATGRDGRIYAFGGGTQCGGPVVLDTAEAYDPRTDSWTTLAPMPTARALATAVTGKDGRIYVIGGLAGEVTSAAVEAYDPRTDTWATLAPMPTPRTWLAGAAGKDGRIYALGGTGTTGDSLATAEVYEPRSDTWSAAASMPTARYGLAAAVGRNGDIYAIAGRSGESSLATVEVYTAR